MGLVQIFAYDLGIFEVLLPTEFDIDLVQAERVNVKVMGLVAFLFLYGFLQRVHCPILVDLVDLVDSDGARPPAIGLQDRAPTCHPATG